MFRNLLEELANRNILREIQERKLESNMRRRRRRDLLRLQVLRVIEVAMFRGLMTSGTMLDMHSGQLSPVLVKILETTRENVMKVF